MSLLYGVQTRYSYKTETNKTIAQQPDYQIIGKQPQLTNNIIVEVFYLQDSIKDENANYCYF